MIQVLSLWRNDADRNIEARVRHLLGKRSTFHDVEWLWGVGDCTDHTLQALTDATLDVVGDGLAVKLIANIVQCDTGIEGESIGARRYRMSAAATILFQAISEDADYILMHESDLISPGTVIDRLLLSKPGPPVAGWPVINMDGAELFYDVWAYRNLEMQMFSQKQARPSGVFEVGSFGSVWLAPADLVRNRVLDIHCIVGLCRKWTSEGVRLWCNPSIKIIQPLELWSPI